MKAHIFNEQFSVKQEVVRLTSIRTHNHTCFNIQILAVLLANVPSACLHNSEQSTRCNIGPCVCWEHGGVRNELLK